MLVQFLGTSPPALPSLLLDDDDPLVAARTAKTAMRPTMTATTSGTRLRAAMSARPTNAGRSRPDFGVRRGLRRKRDRHGCATQPVGEQPRSQRQLGLAGSPQHLSAQPAQHDVD